MPHLVTHASWTADPIWLTWLAGRHANELPRNTISGELHPNVSAGVAPSRIHDKMRPPLPPHLRDLNGSILHPLHRLQLGLRLHELAPHPLVRLCQSCSTRASPRGHDTTHPPHQARPSRSRRASKGRRRRGATKTQSHAEQTCPRLCRTRDRHHRHRPLNPPQGHPCCVEEHGSGSSSPTRRAAKLVDGQDTQSQ